MKKIMITMMTTVCVMLCVMGGVIININEKHENELKSTKYDYDVKIQSLENEIEYLADEYNELNTEHEDLEDGVYKMQNGEAYSIMVHHNDEIHRWKSDGKKWFSTTSHSVTR